MKHAWLLAPILALAAAPAAAQTRAAVTASATVVVPLDSRPPAPEAAATVDSRGSGSGRAGGAVTVTLPDGTVCSGAPPAAGPARVACGDPRGGRSVVVVTA